MVDFAQYPGISGLISPGATVRDVETKQVGGDTFLRVTETIDNGEGGQILLRQRGDAIDVIAQDNVVQFPSSISPQSTIDTRRIVPVTYWGTMNDQQHATVAELAVAKVDVYLTRDGPGHGSVACMWALRHLVAEATGIMITQTDGTGGFYQELKSGHMDALSADDVPDGGIIIAPTMNGQIGHIGLLGAGMGAHRLVYSNHSPSQNDPVAHWKQNYTVGSFTAAHVAIGTFFFRLPVPAAMTDLLADAG